MAPARKGGRRPARSSPDKKPAPKAVSRPKAKSPVRARLSRKRAERPDPSTLNSSVNIRKHLARRAAEYRREKYSDLIETPEVQEIFENKMETKRRELQQLLRDAENDDKKEKVQKRIDKHNALTAYDHPLSTYFKKKKKEEGGDDVPKVQDCPYRITSKAVSEIKVLSSRYFNNEKALQNSTDMLDVIIDITMARKRTSINNNDVMYFTKFRDTEIFDGFMKMLDPNLEMSNKKLVKEFKNRIPSKDGEESKIRIGGDAKEFLEGIDDKKELAKTFYLGSILTQDLFKMSTIKQSHLELFQQISQTS
ncbi:MAG: hypothetical protein O2U61_05005 [Candidatus Bathyarchaeota archaeon]|nr:hypothetical protein [Candidatus Bathyarchaeota archaeon]